MTNCIFYVKVQEGKLLDDMTTSMSNLSSKVYVVKS